MTAQGGRANILLVDDQPAKLMSYEVILSQLGETLLKAHSAREAFEILLKEDIAVLLVDVCMPELDGFELARMLREHPRYERTAIIFISAIHLSDLDRVRGYETGAVDYVPVPVVPEILRAKVRIFVELWRKTQQLERLNDELEQRVRERTGELERSAAQLGETAERLRLASEAAGFGTYDYNVAEGRVYWSPYLREIAGIPGDEPLSIDGAMAVVHPEHRDMVRKHIAAYAPGEGRRELEFKILRPDGETRWLLDRGQVVSTDSGPGQRVMGTVIDITNRKRIEERQRLLMAELDHRVKNILGNVSAIARLSRRSARSVEEFVEALDGRIQAISRAHSLLRRGAWGGADLSEFVDEALSPFLSSGNIKIAAEPVRIVAEVAQSMALILHELATNAMKHGALSNPAGRVTVGWTRMASGHLRFSWQETGAPAATPPSSKGFGLTVLQTAASDLGAVATCDFAPDGFHYTLQGPFEARPPQAVTLPFDTMEANARRAANEDAEPPRARVLIVEDEVLVALQLQKDLEDSGFGVIGPARSLRHGQILASGDSFDVALLDVRLGRETSAAIAEHLVRRNIPFAFATGYSDFTMLPEHLRQVPKLNKPYIVDDVRKVVEDLLSRNAPVHARAERE
jgi:PAS domain S-box-containing protein